MKMTYVIGKREPGLVFLAADSALTISRPVCPRYRQSSFGEKSVHEEQKCVFEGTLKMLNFGDAALAFSGNVAAARELAEALQFSLLRMDNAREALESAVRSCEPYDAASPIDVLVAITSEGSQALFSFDSSCGEIVEAGDGQGFHGGSMPTHLEKVVADYIRLVRPHIRDPHRRLVCLLAKLQSLGVHKYLLDEGVGGVFCGLVAAKGKIEWQRDILYCIHDDLDPGFDMVYSIVRDNVLVVRSTLSKSCRYFADSLTCGSFAKWREKWWDRAYDEIERTEFEYVVFLNKRRRNVVVVEMCGRLEGPYLRLTPLNRTSDGVGLELHFALSPKLSAALVAEVKDRKDGSLPFFFAWFPLDVAMR